MIGCFSHLFWCVYKIKFELANPTCILSWNMTFKYFSHVGYWFLFKYCRPGRPQKDFFVGCLVRKSLCRQLTGQELKCLHYPWDVMHCLCSEVLEFLPKCSAHLELQSLEKEFIYHNIRTSTMMSSEKCALRKNREKYFAGSLISMYWNGKIIFCDLYPHPVVCVN